MGLVNESDIIPTPYGDIWFAVGRRGERVPMYAGRLAELAAIEAFLGGEYGALLTDEIAFFQDAIRTT